MHEIYIYIVMTLVGLLIDAYIHHSSYEVSYDSEKPTLDQMFLVPN